MYPTRLSLMASSDVATPNGAFCRNYENFALYNTPTPVTKTIIEQSDVFSAYSEWVKSTMNDAEETIQDATDHLERLGNWLNSKMTEGWFIDWYAC